MPHRQFDWQNRIKAVERDWKIARLALDRLHQEVVADPTLLVAPLIPSQVPDAVGRLDGTYLIRLFAVFETGLRSYYQSVKRKRPATEALLNAIGSRCHIQYDTIQLAQTVREFRNHLVHEASRDSEPIVISDARSRLCRYFSFLPPEW